MTSIQKTVVVLAALVAIVLGLTVHKVLGSKGDGLDKAALLDAGIILLPQSRELPELTLNNVDGQPQALASLKGKWTLVFFGYTFCPDICPTTLAQLRQLNRLLPAETRSQLHILMVSLDAHRDTPEKLKQYLGFFDPAYLGLTGPLADIQTFANAVSIPFIPGDTSKENYTVDHSGNLVLLGPDWRQRGFIRAPLKNEKLKVQLPQVIKPEA